MQQLHQDGVPGYWKGWLKRFPVLLAACFLSLFTLIFFGPLDIINSNAMYLTFSAGDFALTLALVTVGASLVCAAVLAFIPGRVHFVVLALVTGVGVMLYLQGNVLNGDLGVLDGSSFDWHDVAPQAYVNIAIWIGALVVFSALGLIFHRQVSKIALVICAALVFGQAVALVVSWVPDEDDGPNWQLDGAEEFTFSTDENIIVLTLDQFNPLIFEEQLEADPHFIEVFKDFQYFDNMSSGYSFTFPSLCFLLTHQYFDTTVPTEQAVYNAWHSDTANNFYDTLHEHGYDVHLYLESNYAAMGCENMLGKVDNVVDAGGLVVTQILFEFVTDMSLYRYLPTMLKNDYCVSTGAILDVSTYQGATKLRINYDFQSSLEKEGISLTDDHNVFNWYHMQGAHFPFVVDYDGYLCDEDETDRTEQLHGYLMMLETFLNDLKEAGVYDDATIIISADHGYFECFQTVFMIKLPGQTFDTFSSTSAPVAQEDIMPTILSILGEDYSDYGSDFNDEGTTVYDWNEGDYRLRTTRVWGYMTGYPDVEWIGNMDQWDAAANGFERYNVFGVFHYNGDRETILYKERYWYNYGYADEIQPLYDSFY